jgi:YVTN family beta-propeller protein
MNIRQLFHPKLPLRRSSWMVMLVLASLAIFASACAPVPASGAVPNTGASVNLAPTLQMAVNPTVPAPTMQMAANPTASAPAGPKAYIGLFKDNAVAVLDTQTQQVLTRIPVPTGPHGIVITPDGRWVYVSSDGDTKVSVIDTSLDKVVKTIEVGKGPHGLALTPDGHTLLAAVFGANQVVFIDTSTNTVTGQVSVPNPHNIAIRPDGQTAYIASQPQTSPSLVILNLGQKTQTGSVPLTKIPRALNFSPDGKQLYFTQAGIDAVQVLDPATNQIKTQIPVGASPHHPLFTPNGQMALVVSQGPGQLSILDPNTNSVSKVVTVGKMPHWIAVNSAGTTAWVTNEASNDVSVVDLASGKVTATLPVGNGPRKIVVQPQTSLPPQSPTLGAASGAMVTIKGLAFSPLTLSVKAGQSITWENQDSITHTVTSDDNKWTSTSLDPGKTFTLTLTQPGQYKYHCSIHPFMTGTINVTP